MTPRRFDAVIEEKLVLMRELLDDLEAVGDVSPERFEFVQLVVTSPGCRLAQVGARVPARERLDGQPQQQATPRAWQPRFAQGAPGQQPLRRRGCVGAGDLVDLGAQRIGEFPVAGEPVIAELG